MPEKTTRTRAPQPVPVNRRGGASSLDSVNRVTSISDAPHSPPHDLPRKSEIFLRPENEAELYDEGFEPIRDEKVEEYLDRKVIGERIRALRLKRSMGLIELGSRTGLSASFLSQLETGRVLPTLRNLARIALVFEKDLSWFFRDNRTVNFRILRRSDRVRLILDRKEGFRFISESLGVLVPDRNIVPCLAEFYPRSAPCEFTPKIFTGQEFIYIIDGALWITTPREHQLLEAGDVAWIDGSTKRQYECSGENTARAMIITFPKE